MTFQEILPEFLKGCKIRKIGWEDNKFIQLDSKLGFIIDENRDKFSLEGYDLLTSEWEFLEIKYFNWNKAYELMKEGKKVLRKGLEPKDFIKCYLFLDNGYFLSNINDSNHFYYLKSEDFEAKDWYLVGGEKIRENDF